LGRRAPVPPSACPTCPWRSTTCSAGRPGTRAPHLPIEIAVRRSSTLDLIGPGFTLLTTSDAWSGAATELGVTTHQVAPADQFTAAFGRSPTGAALVRPDGVIAWRGTDPTRLRNVISPLLAR
jgi:putative polyketide hydroxylase